MQNFMVLDKHIADVVTRIHGLCRSELPSALLKFMGYTISQTDLKNHIFLMPEVIMYFNTILRNM